MKICVAQTNPVKGDIQSNIASHKKLIALAVSHGADSIFFPELSITGYEPELAKELATDKDDTRFDDFQIISNNNHIIIGVGMPIKSTAGILISMLLFQPHQPRKTYSKQHLHADELLYFTTGNQPVFLTNHKHKMALAICYELSVPEHADNASKNGATVYIASVAKTVMGVENAISTLAAIASNYSMTVLLSNCVGYCDNFDCGGKTSVWNNKGILAGQLNETGEGILIFDTDTGEITEQTI